MFENIMKFFKKLIKAESQGTSKETAKERLHLVLLQDRANVSADFLDMMKQEIIEVIKKYIDVDENAIDVRLTNKSKEDGTNGGPALYANIPIISIKEEAKQQDNKTDQTKEQTQQQEVNQDKKEEQQQEDIQEKITQEVEDTKKDCVEEQKEEVEQEEVETETKIEKTTETEQPKEESVIETETEQDTKKED